MYDMTQKEERFLMKYHQPPLHMNVVSKLNILITHKRTQAKNTSVLGYRKTNLTSEEVVDLANSLFCCKNKNHYIVFSKAFKTNLSRIMQCYCIKRYRKLKYCYKIFASNDVKFE